MLVLNSHDLNRQAVVVALLLAAMALNVTMLWSSEAIPKRGVAKVLRVIGCVLAVLQASRAVQIVMHSLHACSRFYADPFPRADEQRRAQVGLVWPQPARSSPRSATAWLRTDLMAWFAILSLIGFGIGKGYED